MNTKTDLQTAALPAVGCSITMNLGGDRQLVMQSFFPQEGSDDEANRLLDRMIRLAERQKARCDIPGLEDEIEQQEKALARFEEDFAKLEAKHKLDQGVRVAKMTECNKVAEEERQAGYEEWSSTGRRGTYEAKGARKQAIERANAEMRQIQAEQQKADNERAQHLESIAKSRIRFKEEIDVRKRKIANAKGMIGE